MSLFALLARGGHCEYAHSPYLPHGDRLIAQSARRDRERLSEGGAGRGGKGKQELSAS